ncbi:LamG domain-containing protein [Micromonospora sp. HK10]|uniref:LamG domain-containing protein n=1 Tax=Micromonospora sp. HK10 TaxID=1538294 RepID=UPI0006967B1D|nr:LamG domain-containing protein [Micromonospora sp. HK10]
MAQRWTLPENRSGTGRPDPIRHRLAGLTAVALAAAAGMVAVTAATPTPARAAAAPVCADSKASEREAVATAAACGRPVVVGSSRSEYTQVTAQPDGRLRFESAVEPQRTRRADGTWADVDLSLRAGADGLLRPVASVADVAFSAGGDRPLISLKRAGRSLTFSWPGRLPTPTVSGDSATYAGVLPDVDLVVRATHTGFTHVLVVKSPSAAANPAVREIALKTGGDVTLSRHADGSLTAAAGATAIARSQPAVMWDSALPKRAAAAAHEAARGRSDALTAGDGARTAAVATRVAKGELRLVPDAALLAGATYPVYVDPAWSVAKSRWAYATSDGCTNTDYSVARVGYSPDGPCVGSRFRSYFEFPTTNGSVSLKGKYIYSAYVQMNLYHSWSCGNTWAHMYLVPVINATMKASYSGMKLKSWMDSAEGHANKGSGCSDSPQPDMTMNFTGSGVKSQVQAAATGSWSTLTVGFCACNPEGQYETAQDRWKKFTPGKAKLIVDYDSRPGKPTNFQIAGVACATSGVTTIGTLSPTFSAVYPDADTTQALTGTYEWIEVPSGGMGTVTDTYPARKPKPANVSAPANGRAVTAAVALVKDKTYAFRVTAVDPAPYSQWSGWSAWCQFKADTTVPPVTVTVVTPPAGPGQPGTFKISSTATDVTSFKYGWTGATTSVAATTVNGVKQATVTLTAPKYGTNILYASAVDGTLNEGYGSAEFIVGRPRPAVARWTLETYPGQTQAAALADQQSGYGDTDGAGPLVKDSPLTASNLTWSSDTHLIGGSVATMNGTTSEAQTAMPVVDTSQSFSVAAWLRLPAMPTWDTVALAQDGADAAGFQLGTRMVDSVAKWSFSMKNNSAQSSVTRAATQTIEVSEVGKWVHLVGVYDRAAGKIRLYVDDQPAMESAGPSTPWQANGVFAVGRGWVDGAKNKYWKGSIADVQVYDRVLVDHDFTGQLKSDPDSGGVDEPGMLTPTTVGQWSFARSAGCFIQDLADTCQAGDLTGFDRWLALQRGADPLADGLRDTGLALDNTIDGQTGTREWARTAYKKGVTAPDAAGLQYTIWQNTPVLRTDQSFTVSAWVKLDRTDVPQTVLAQEGSVNNGFYLYYLPDNGGEWKFKMLKDAATQDGGTGSTIVAAPAQDPDASWHHLVGVLDVGHRQLKLYVDGEIYRSETSSATSSIPLNAAWQPWQANGPLRVGSGIGDANLLFGTIDEVGTYQGAMTDAQVRTLYDTQVVRDPTSGE